ncbi:MAG: hypothetical protein ABI978_00245 [Chloroflexota bacterium]
MERHRVDVLSLVAGMLFLAIGLVLLSGGLSAVPMEWAGPAVAIGLGVMIVVAARPEKPSTDEGPSTTEES